MVEDEAEDSGSTLVRSGKSALTFTEMASFVRDIEARPAARLLEDLGGLLALPEAKYSLVAMVIRRKMRPEAPEREGLFRRLTALQGAEDPIVRERSRLVLAGRE